ncbi:MAG: MBL fold metallo-hydrolase, partial [Myxococcota bacterium]|nr:MBL fold metallo-hydrolase [Myxococcota bacterium]
MLVERIFIDNPLRNFHYLVACPQTGRALAIDPLETDAVLQVAARRGWQIDTVVCTHHHWDHAGGRDAMRKATGARICAHREAPLDGIDQGLSGGDRVRVGQLEL